MTPWRATEEIQRIHPVTLVGFQRSKGRGCRGRKAWRQEVQAVDVRAGMRLPMMAKRVMKMSLDSRTCRRRPMRGMLGNGIACGDERCVVAVWSCAGCVVQESW